MNYVLDTNAVLLYLRDDKTKRLLEETYEIFLPHNTAIASLATVAEIYSIGLQRDWGARKIKLVRKFLNRLVVVEIRFGELIDAYIQIDAFSQGNLKNRPLKFTARNMGKNDLWIAATAYVTESKLLTTDRDFEHLHGEFFDVIFIDR